jgi:hypothetical protein
MREVMLANGAAPAEPTRADDGSGLDTSVFMDFLPQGVRIIDRHYRIVRINRSFSELSGVSPRDARDTRCFEIFKSENRSGIGLGLALTKMLVELHGGRMFLKSEPGKGSTFGFSIPIQQAGQDRG